VLEMGARSMVGKAWAAQHRAPGAVEEWKSVLYVRRDQQVTHVCEKRSTGHTHTPTENSRREGARMF